MFMKKIIHKTAVIFCSASLLVFAHIEANASDYYDASTGTIHLREVAVGDAVYKRVSVGLGQVQSLAQGDPRASASSYSPNSGLLSIPFIRVGTSAFTNAAVTITDVRRVESELRSSTTLPSGETYGAFQAAVLAAWRQTPQFMDAANYQAQLRQLEASKNCYGFGSDDIIPGPKTNLNWGGGVHVNTLFPMRTTNYQRVFNPISAFPSPFVRVAIDANVYAMNDERISQLRRALVDRLIHLGSANPNSAVRQELRVQLLDYARANALSEGLLTNWSSTVTPNTPVHFEIISLSLNLIHAFSHSAPLFSPAERQIVGDWLNRLVARVLTSAWSQNKQDNKVYYRSQVALAWGLITGDSELVRNAITIYKHAVYEMRPDGSFINESSRGGSANLYQSQATDSVLSLAVGLEENLGLPALSFQIEGKSVWTAMGRVLDAYADQVRVASQYGKSCEEGSFGSVTAPDPRWGANLQSISFLRVALKRDGLGGTPNRIRTLPWASYYYPEREGLDLMALLGD
jgi:hypothetical protein